MTSNNLYLLLIVFTFLSSCLSEKKEPANQKTKLANKIIHNILNQEKVNNFLKYSFVNNRKNIVIDTVNFSYNIKSYTIPATHFNIIANSTEQKKSIVLKLRRKRDTVLYILYIDGNNTFYINDRFYVNDSLNKRKGDSIINNLLNKNDETLRLLYFAKAKKINTIKIETTIPFSVNTIELKPLTFSIIPIQKSSKDISLKISKLHDSIIFVLSALNSNHHHIIGYVTKSNNWKPHIKKDIFINDIDTSSVPKEFLKKIYNK